MINRLKFIGRSALCVAALGALTGTVWAEVRPCETARLQAQVYAAWRRGGGEVVVESGEHRIGSVRLRSGVTLRLKSGARIVGSTEIGDYLGTLLKDAVEPVDAKALRTSAEDLTRRSQYALFCAYGAHDIRVIGESGSVIDGVNCYDPKGGEGYRGPHAFSFAASTNVTFSGVTVVHSADYAIKVLLCRNVRISGVTVKGGHDGIHFDLCDDVRIADSTLTTGDDSVAGSGCSDIVVTNCFLSSACSPFRLGGRNVLVVDCRVKGPCDYPHRWTLTPEEKAARATTSASGRRTTGAFYQGYTGDVAHRNFTPGNIVIRNVSVEGVERFLVSLSGLPGALWQDGRGITDITFENVTATELGLPSAVVAKADEPLKLTLRNCSFSFRSHQSRAFFGKNITVVDEGVRLANADRLYEQRTDVTYDDIPEFPSWRIESNAQRAKWKLPPLAATGAGRTPQEILHCVNDRLEREFISHDGLLLDYVGEIPTAEEIADLKPNAMGWWCPIENGSMFTGEWLPALMAEGAARKALVEKCVRGLVGMSEVSDVPGFIARGTGTDGKSHHPLGSNDQTDPWFFGLCEYCRWPHADPALKAKALERLVFVARALERNGWGVPCDGAFKGENRGNLNAKAMPFWGKSRLLYSLKSLHRLTGDAHWSAVYESLKAEALVEIEAAGEIDKKAFSGCYGWGVWIYLSSVQALVRLIEMEENPNDRARMRKGLLHYAERVAPLMKDRAKYANTTERPFRYANWRTGYAWRVQKTQKDAEAVAHSGKREILGTRKDCERSGMSIPLCAAAICALSGEAKYQGEILATLRHYDYSTPNISEFFHAAVAAAAMGNTGEDALVKGGVRAGDFGAPQVIVTEVAPERAHLAWPKIASDGGVNLVVGFVAAREHVEGNGVIGCAVSSAAAALRITEPLGTVERSTFGLLRRGRSVGDALARSSAFRDWPILAIPRWRVCRTVRGWSFFMPGKS